MFAIVKTGGKQYTVKKDDIIEVERLEANIGDKLNLEVLLVGDENGVVAGTPIVKGASVTAEVVSEGKNKKIVIFKYKAKKNVRRRQGHKQPYTALKILEIKK